MITITKNKGFQMTFENGLTISCQIGSYNYCNNHDLNKFGDAEMSQPFTSCENCEIAIWNKDEDYITGEIFNELGMTSTEDAAAGWVDTMTVAKLITYVSARTK